MPDLMVTPADLRDMCSGEPGLCTAQSGWNRSNATHGGLPCWTALLMIPALGHALHMALAPTSLGPVLHIALIGAKCSAGPGLAEAGVVCSAVPELLEQQLRAVCYLAEVTTVLWPN